MNAPRSLGKKERLAVVSLAFATGLIACAGFASVLVSGPPVLWAATLQAPPQPAQVQALRVNIPADPFAGVGGRIRRLARQGDKGKNWHWALARWEAVAGLDPKDKEAKRRISEIRSLLKRGAEKHLKEAQAHLKRKSIGKAFKSFLRALSYDPQNAQALDMVKYELNAKSLTEYKVVRGDTIRDIAVAEYKDPEMTFLIMYYNEIKDARKIEVDQILKLPVMAGVIPKDKGPSAVVAALAKSLSDALKSNTPSSASAEAAEAVAPAESGRSAVSPLASAMTLSAAAEAMPSQIASAPEQAGAEESEFSGEATNIKYQQAQKLYDEGDFMKAAVAAEEVLEEDPANGQARELVNAAYYADGTKLQGQNKYVAAMQSLSRVDPGYKDTPQRVEKLQGLLKGQQAEMHYIAGVTFFLNEDLDNAIREWEEVLKLESGHPQASKDLANAKALQDKLLQVQ